MTAAQRVAARDRTSGPFDPKPGALTIRPSCSPFDFGIELKKKDFGFHINYHLKIHVYQYVFQIDMTVVICNFLPSTLSVYSHSAPLGKVPREAVRMKSEPLYFS